MTDKNNNSEDHSENSFDRSLFNLLEKVAQGDVRAENQVHEEFAARLGKLASRNINGGLLRRFDHEDVVQSVFRTFFRRNENGEFHVNNSRQLWSLLAHITVLKTRSYIRNQLADKRDLNLEASGEEAEQISAGKYDPEAMAIVQEEIDSALDGLPEKAAEILSLRLSGHSKTEIAELTNRSRQTVHATLKLIHDRLQESFELSSKS